MNSSKVSLPSLTIINIYYYFSSFTLLATWFIAPFLFYIILTQSKCLKCFKWFLLNHAICCLAFETFLGLVKPLYLCPAPGIYPLGILKDGNSYITGFATIIGYITISNCVIGVFATITDRYLFLFPNSVINLNKKTVLTFLVCCLIIFYCFIIYSFGMTLLFHTDSTFKNAIEYDPFFHDFQISTFFFLPLKFAPNFFICGTTILAFLLLAAIATMTFFICKVKFQKTQATEICQNSLIVISIMQILLTCLFLILPNIVVGCLYIFQVPHCSGFMCLIFSLVSCRSCLEFLAILYYVAPYRKFIYQKWECLRGRKKSRKANIVVVSAAVMSLQ